MPNKTDKTDKTENTDIDVLTKGINMTELIATTTLDILPKYQIIPKGDFATVRHVNIVSMPKLKFIEKLEKDLTFMVISDNGVNYSLTADSITLKRSILACAIKLCKAKIESDIDISILIGKRLGLRREKFKAKGFDAEALKFFLLDE